LFVGYVRIVYTSLTDSAVSIIGEDRWWGRQSQYIVFFPPNPTHFLAELIRAQNHPHMRVEVYAKEKGAQRIITNVNVYWDYDQPPLQAMPSFDAKAT
jgi:hypothetical protein